MNELGRSARLLALRPPLAFGGHSFSLLQGDGIPLSRCVGCLVTLPSWAVAEGMGHHFGLHRWCPHMFRALT